MSRQINLSMRKLVLTHLFGSIVCLMIAQLAAAMMDRNLPIEHNLLIVTVLLISSALRLLFVYVKSTHESIELVNDSVYLNGVKAELKLLKLFSLKKKILITSESGQFKNIVLVDQTMVTKNDWGALLEHCT
ncbi:hypothetical protein ABVY47_004587 [Vibrio parahaemolyticus]|uniref:hypothetical protein n=1 Tax=Vibrio parahaemolyticus TaxID=670 RepID=UPI001DA8C748|nr:hypothetical protein [Vibrio parahaemolyticus]EGR3135972.1 hypothetical protein [Vibrio parahaemolyticus]EHY8868588.1 hypothetical protein [Vibrio parahaemolyticus]EII3132200.1 hypothetical protein [Vibrio parahaemolyticus]EJC6794154.1 hypothetical protein [Vibrio parahaemolyticus]EJC6850757.1 hypothetical protein [Vibrio parahaemolyticus]